MAGAASFPAGTLPALAGDTVTIGGDLQPLDPGSLAVTIDPAQPAAAAPLAVSRTPLPAVPGLPLSAKDKATFGDQATTIGVLPSAGAPQGPSVSWSGYARAGVVYHGSN